MIQKGFKLVHPTLGEYMEVLQTADDLNGKSLVMEIGLSKDGVNPVEHIHETVDEHFEILSGKMSYTLEDQKGYLEKGQTLTLPRNVRHRHWNEQPEMLILRQTISPASDFADIVANLFKMNVDGKMKNGDPPLLAALTLIRYGKDKTYLATLPRGLQKGLANILGPVGRMMGYSVEYVS